MGRLSSCAPSTSASPVVPLVARESILLDTPEATTRRWRIAEDSLKYTGARWGTFSDDLQMLVELSKREPRHSSVGPLVPLETFSAAGEP